MNMTPEDDTKIRTLLDLLKSEIDLYYRECNLRATIFQVHSALVYLWIGAQGALLLAAVSSLEPQYEHATSLGLGAFVTRSVFPGVFCALAGIIGSHYWIRQQTNDGKYVRIAEGRVSLYRRAIHDIALLGDKKSAHEPNEATQCEQQKVPHGINPEHNFFLGMQALINYGSGINVLDRIAKKIWGKTKGTESTDTNDARKLVTKALEEMDMEPRFFACYYRGESDDPVTHNGKEIFNGRIQAFRHMAAALSFLINLGFVFSYAFISLAKFGNALDISDFGNLECVTFGALLLLICLLVYRESKSKPSVTREKETETDRTSQPSNGST